MPCMASDQWTKPRAALLHMHACFLLTASWPHCGLCCARWDDRFTSDCVFSTRVQLTYMPCACMLTYASLEQEGAVLLVQHKKPTMFNTILVSSPGTSAQQPFCVHTYKKTCTVMCTT